MSPCTEETQHGDGDLTPSRHINYRARLDGLPQDETAFSKVVFHGSFMSLSTSLTPET